MIETNLIILDSISYISAAHRGCVVVSGSHGGLSSGRYALEHPPLLAVFNDAGVAKDAAGIAALAQLERAGIAAVTVRADSARIGDGQDTWEHGVISHENEGAEALGLQRDRSLRVSLEAVLKLERF